MNADFSALTVMGLATIVAFYAGRLARLCRLPSLIGYMLLGVLIGPGIINLISEDVLLHTSFITEIALGFVAFTIGSELSLAVLGRLKRGIIAIIFAESFAAFLVVFAAVFALTRNLPMSLIFGAVAPASAPAGTVAVIQESRAKGNLTSALYAVVGFDDGLAVLIFGFAAAAAKSLLLHDALQTSPFPAADALAASPTILHAMMRPSIEIVLSLLVGVLAGVLFCLLVGRLDHDRDRLIVAFGTVLLVTGLSIQWHLSLILANMTVGFVLANSRRPTLAEHATRPLLGIMPLIFVFFFCLAGAHLRVGQLPALGLLGIVYILARSTGLIAGARIGAVIGRAEEKIRKYIGLGILSQAGVAIGLSLIMQHELAELYRSYPEAFDRLAPGLGPYHPLAIGAALITTVTATSVVFEIVGPILTRIALAKAGEIPAAPDPTEAQTA